jgi:anaerobic ribonucleoside-triphosphate reductase activating protein
MMENMISAMGLNPESKVDGSGIRIVLYCAGCNHQCRSCHNPETWDINNGTFTSVQEIYSILISEADTLTTGITFSGGEPMLQARAFSELAKIIKDNTEWNIWCYTGYTFEDIVDDCDEKFELLKDIDVLVDGRYIGELKDSRLKYRGSSNQRIINVRQSLQENIIVELNDTDFKI